MSDNLERLLGDAKVVAVLDAQWGDTGKGKFSDLIASEWADVVARGTGGNNAGHTVVVGDVKRKFHLLPSGVVFDNRGVVTVLGNGMVIDLAVLVSELKELEEQGLSYINLKISEDAHVIMPYHVRNDKEKNQSQKRGSIGSTGRGIGPCYEDKIARYGIRVIDLMDKNRAIERINRSLKRHPDAEESAEEIFSILSPAIEKLRPYVTNTIALMHRFVGEGKKILLEGAQGLLLSVDYGTYPYVTSSDCSVSGTAAGVGIPASQVDECFSIVKFPFMTRVGGGPFPTEIAGEVGESYCADESHTNEEELKKYAIDYTLKDGSPSYDPQDTKIIALMNSDSELEKAIGLRLSSFEYGTTTGRPRRVGWTDAVSAKYAGSINGPKFIFTKVDCLAGMEKFKVCVGHKVGDNILTDFDRNEHILRKIEPMYKEYKGYGGIAGETDYEKLPESLKQAISDFEEYTKGKVVAVSTGPDRDQTIIR